MRRQSILVIGGGIGGLTAAIALSRDGHEVTLFERDPSWSVYGVGIIQQANVVRAMAQLGLVEHYLAAGVGFDAVEIFAPDGSLAARVPSPRLAPKYPANVGIGRPALHEVLGRAAIDAGAKIRLGQTVNSMNDIGTMVDVTASDGSTNRYDIVIGADGIYSQTRGAIFPGARDPAFTGQAVWRYNFTRPSDLDCLRVYNGPTGAGLVPISQSLMYLFVTTPEPGNPDYPRKGLAAAMRAKTARCAPQIRALAEQITDDEGVVYRPLETLLLKSAWHQGRTVLLGDAVHATTPHLGQGAGMAIEDSLVLAEEISRHEVPEDAFTAYRARRFARCEYIVASSLAICRGQLGDGPLVDNHKATAEMFAVTAEPI